MQHCSLRLVHRPAFSEIPDRKIDNVFSWSCREEIKVNSPVKSFYLKNRKSLYRSQTFELKREVRVISDSLRASNRQYELSVL